LRGVAAILFGVMAFVWPGLELLFLVFLFGAYALVDGVLALVGAIRSHESGNHRVLMALEGLTGVVLGAVTLVMPSITGFLLLYLIAAWAFVTGVIEVFLAIQLRKEIQNEWVLILTGFLSIVFAAFLAFSPGSGALAVAWLIGSYAIFFGVLMVVPAFAVRNHPNLAAT